MSEPDKMRVCMCTDHGGYEVMQVVEDAKPKSPDAGQVSRVGQSMTFFIADVLSRFAQNLIATGHSSSL